MSSKLCKIHYYKLLLVFFLLSISLCGTEKTLKEDEELNLDIEANEDDDDGDGEDEYIYPPDDYLSEDDFRQFSSLLLDSNGKVNQEMVKTLKEAYKVMQDIGKAGELDKMGFLEELDKLKDMDFSELQKNLGPNSESLNDDEKIEPNLKFDEEDIAKLKEYHGSMGDDAFFEKTKNMLTDPGKNFDSYREMSVESLVSKLAERLGTNVEKLGKINSVSESLEFVIDFYKKARLCEEKLDKLYKSFNILEEEENFLRGVKAMKQSTENLIQRTQMLIRRFQSKIITRKEFGELLRVLAYEKEDLVNKQLDDLEKIHLNMTSSEEIKEMEAEKKLMHEEVNKYSDMSVSFIKHLMGLKSHVGLQDSLLPSSGQDFNEKVRLNLLVYEQLLEKHQKLDDLKNQVLLEKKKKKKDRMEEDINFLEETEIPEFVSENSKELQKYLIATMGIASRNMKKLINLDLLIRGIQKVQVEYVQTGEAHTLLMTQLKDLLEDAAEIYMKGRKTEL